MASLFGKCYDQEGESTVVQQLTNGKLFSRFKDLLQQIKSPTFSIP
jgi:hypothetical protein